MTDIGNELRAKREALGLTQAQVGDAVHTTQQTVARIERGETTHSRYIGKIRDFLDGKAHGDAPALQPTTAPTFTLGRDGMLQDADQRTQLHFADVVGDVYAVHLQQGAMGPMGDPIFRPGEILIIDPSAVPRHYSWALKREGSIARLMLVVDRAQMPPQMDADQLREWGYAVPTPQDERTYHAVIAHYMV